MNGYNTRSKTNITDTGKVMPKRISKMIANKKITNLKKKKSNTITRSFTVWNSRGNPANNLQKTDYLHTLMGNNDVIMIQEAGTFANLNNYVNGNDDFTVQGGLHLGALNTRCNSAIMYRSNLNITWVDLVYLPVGTGREAVCIYDAQTSSYYACMHGAAFGPGAADRNTIQQNLHVLAKQNNANRPANFIVIGGDFNATPDYQSRNATNYQQEDLPWVYKYSTVTPTYYLNNQNLWVTYDYFLVAPYANTPLLGGVTVDQNMNGSDHRSASITLRF